MSQGSQPPSEAPAAAAPAETDAAATVSGSYGGTMRRAFKGVSDRVGPTKLVYHGLVWYDPELNMRPNLAETAKLIFSSVTSLPPTFTAH